MSNKKAKKKQLKRQKALRRQLQNQEVRDQDQKQTAPKRKISTSPQFRRRLKQATPKLLILVTIWVIGGILWAVISQNQAALAHEPLATANTPTNQSGEIVIRRSTYAVAGQPVAVRVSGDPNTDNNRLF